MMNTQWILETHGDPLGTLREFVHDIWQQFELDKMLAPLNGGESATTKLRILDNPGRLKDVNPFKPLMTMNAARLVPDLVREHKADRLGAMLRPCEMRALIEMVKHDSFKIDRLLSVSVDCLGTFPGDEYQWRAQRKGSSHKLTQEALQFARQGGIVPYRYRSACQFCVTPDAQGADINIGVLGLPVRQYLLVEISDRNIARRLQFKAHKVDPVLVNQREQTIAKLVERHQRIHERVIRSLADSLPATTDDVVTLFANCTACQACLDVCPICLVDYPRQGEDGRYHQDDVARWLVSCAGCGMCEQVCPNHLPLSAIFSHIREQLAQETGYSPGQAVAEPLPWSA